MKVEIREVVDPETEEKYKGLFFDGALFDWGMPQAELTRARSFCGQDPFLKKTVHGDICRFFLDCLSQVLEREITIRELNAAIEQGYLE
jgi:hypothetical protein